MPVLSSPQLLACSTELGYALGFSYPEARGSLSPTSTPCTRCCLPSFLMWPSAIMRSLKSPGMSTLAWLTSWRSAVSFLLPGFYQGKKKIDNEKYGAGKPICFYFILSLFFSVVKTLEVLFVGKKPSLSKETVTLYVTEGFQAYLATVWNLKYV